MESSERVYMVVGEDGNGDQHLFATDNVDRARAARQEMDGRFVKVRGNWAADELLENDEKELDPFTNPDITILTPDSDATMALWEMANNAKDRGDISFEMTEKMQKAFTPDRVHEIWIVLNDALQSGALLTAIYTALKAVNGLSGKRMSIRIGGRIRIARDEQDRLESLGCELVFDKQEASLELPIEDKSNDVLR